MTMNYLGYVLITGISALAASIICLAAMWLLVPGFAARLRGAEPEAPETAPDPAPRPAAAQQGPRFNFTPEQAPALAALLEREADDDVAAVLWHLPPETGRALLAALPAARRNGAALSLAVQRDADMAFVRAAMGELENRLCGRMGGPEGTAALVKALPYGDRKALLDGICAADPARAAGVRALLLTCEDLADAPEQDLRSLAAAVPPHAMAAYLPALPDKLRDRIKAAYPAKGAEALDKGRPPAGRKEADDRISEFLDLVEKVAARGLMPRPKPRIKAAAPKPAPAAADDWG